MTLASMSSPEYFEPAKINKDEVFISGDNVAKSPAFFSYMFTKKSELLALVLLMKNHHNQNSLNTVSLIGSNIC